MQLSDCNHPTLGDIQIKVLEKKKSPHCYFLNRRKNTKVLLSADDGNADTCLDELICERSNPVKTLRCPSHPKDSFAYGRMMEWNTVKDKRYFIYVHSMKSEGIRIITLLPFFFFSA